MRRPWVPVLVFLLGVLPHVESLGDWFTGADTFALIETSRITSLADVWTILTEPLMYGTSYVHIGLFYRPLVNFTYALDYWLWGLNPVGYHLTNLVLHGLAAILVVGTIRSLTASPRTGVLAGVLFAIHPLSTDTVPAITRCQDILLAVFGLLTLWLFVEGLRRKQNSQRLRWATAAAYALALLSKETAIVLGPLAFLWALLRQPSLREFRTYRRAIREVLPLIGVTVVYLAVRVAVIGGIGGYSRSPPLSKTLLIPVQYVLALAYPAHVFGALGDVAPPVLVAVGVGVPVAYLMLLHRERSFRELGILRSLLVIVAVAGFGVVTAISLVPGPMSSIHVQHVDYGGWYAAGLVFVLAAASGVVAALSASHTSVAGNRRLDRFFLVWVVLPLPLFLLGKEFTFRSAYFFVVPFLALLATHLVKFVSVVGSESSWIAPSTDTAFALVAVALLVPSLAASPLFYTDSGWNAVGNITKQTMTGVDSKIPATASTHLVVSGVPVRMRHHPKRLGEARERTVLHPFSVRAWIRLHGHPNPVTVTEVQFFRTPPRAISTTVTRKGRNLIVTIHYKRQRTSPSRSRNRRKHAYPDSEGGQSHD